MAAKKTASDHQKQGRATSVGTPAKPPQSAMPQMAIPYERIAKLALEKWMKGGCKHGCDQQNWLEAEAELMRAEMAKAGAMPSRAKAEEGSFQSVESLTKKLYGDDPGEREYANAKLALFGREGFLSVINDLNSDSAAARAEAREEFFAIFRGFAFPSKLRKALESGRPETRAAAIREIAMIVPAVRAAMAAQLPGWDSLASLIARSEPVTEDQTMPKLIDPKPVSTAIIGVEKKERQSREELALPEWKPHLNSYTEKQVLRFACKEDLHAAVDLLWTDPFRTLPHDSPDGRSIVVPAEAVEHLARAGLKFTATRLRSIREFPPEEIAKMRR